MLNKKMLICCGCNKVRFSRNNHYVGPWLPVETVPDIPGMESDHTFCPDCYVDYELMVVSDAHTRGAATLYGEESLER
jgi:hypothetical protein